MTVSHSRIQYSLDEVVIDGASCAVTIMWIYETLA